MVQNKSPCTNGFFASFFRKKYPKKYQKKMPTQRKRELFFRRFDSSRLAKTRAFPSALLRLAKDAPARRRVRSMKPRVISTRKTREVRWRPARARFRTEFVPRNVFVTLFFFGSKSAIREHAHEKAVDHNSLSQTAFFP